MSDPAEVSLVDRIWLAMSSLRTTAILAILLASVAAIAAIVPQGRDALELLELPHTDQLQVLAAWGLTDLFQSAWVRAIAVLIAGNVLAVTLRALRRGSVETDFGVAPARAPHSVELASPTPETAVEDLRATFRDTFGGAPTDERVDGAKVTMSFVTNSSAELAPLMAHLGLIAMVVGAGMSVEPVPIDQSVVRALLEVKDSKTQTVGMFDMVQDESRQFFQWRPRYFLRNYAASRNGMGPAVRLEKVIDDTKRIDEFWVYLDAPPYFDERHRKGLVSVRALSMGWSPRPGKGLSQSSGGLFLMAGFGLLLIGAFGGSRAHGRVWITVDGDRVRIVGVPARSGDGSFASAFDRWSMMARATLET